VVALAVALVNLALIAAAVYLGINDHPILAFLCLAGMGFKIGGGKE
jgi:hypothetical protein